MANRTSPSSLARVASRSAGRRYNEDTLVKLTGLPGPLIEELLPRQATADGYYTRTARVYTAENLFQARLAAELFKRGIRYRYIRAAVRAGGSIEELNKVLVELQQQRPRKPRRLGLLRWRHPQPTDTAARRTQPPQAPGLATESGQASP